MYIDEYEFFLPVPSFGMAENALCALKTAQILKIDIGNNPFEGFKFPEMRMEIKQIRNSVIILDSYNANPISMEDAIKAVNLFHKKEKYLFMGDMLELGKYSEMYHREIAHIVKVKDFNGIFTYGEFSKLTAEEANKIGLFAKHYKDKKEMKQKLYELMKRDSVILIKGSRRMEMEKLLEE